MALCEIDLQVTPYNILTRRRPLLASESKEPHFDTVQKKDLILGVPKSIFHIDFNIRFYSVCVQIECLQAIQPLFFRVGADLYPLVIFLGDDLVWSKHARDLLLQPSVFSPTPVHRLHGCSKTSATGGQT